MPMPTSPLSARRARWRNDLPTRHPRESGDPGQPHHTVLPWAPAFAGVTARHCLMPTHAERQIVPYRPDQLFDLVADVGKYPQFLPWCVAARVRSRAESELVADLTIGFGPHRVAHNGERDPDYDESAVSAYMKGQEITIAVDLGLGRGKDRVYSCDLTKDYVAINGDYRS